MNKDKLDHQPVPDGYRSVKDALPIALVRAREALLAFYRPMIAERGFTEPQWRLLRIVNEYEPIDITTLSHYCGLHTPSVTRILKTLDRDGYIDRQRDVEDTRRSWISVTQKTCEIMYQSGAKSVAIREKVFEQFSEEKMNQLADLANELAEIRPRQSTTGE
ncbi:MAG: MarR family transcriptional regulator [Amylibacter sp.]|jgi:homoprotocatechuate degradation regulator HpaR|nr:MarR family transcriptional regulator [Amylibacter sp.]